MPDELARFLQIPPYDQDNSLHRKDHHQQHDEDSHDDEMKNVLLHAACISINDYRPWNNDHQGKI